MHYVVPDVFVSYLPGTLVALLNLPSLYFVVIGISWLLRGKLCVKRCSMPPIFTLQLLAFIYFFIYVNILNVL